MPHWKSKSRSSRNMVKIPCFCAWARRFKGTRPTCEPEFLTRIYSTETLTLQAVKKILLICNAPFSVLISSCYALEGSMTLPFIMAVGKTLVTSRQPLVEVASTKAVYLEEGDAFPFPGTQCIGTGIGSGPMCFGNNRPTRISLRLGLSLRIFHNGNTTYHSHHRFLNLFQVRLYSLSLTWGPGRLSLPYSRELSDSVQSLKRPDRTGSYGHFSAARNT